MNISIPFHPDRLLSVHVAAKRLKRPDRTLRHWINRGILPAKRNGIRPWVIREADIEILRRRLEVGA